MHILIDIGNSTVVIAMTDNKGDITATWRFKTKKPVSSATNCAKDFASTMWRLLILKKSPFHR